MNFRNQLKEKKAPKPAEIKRKYRTILKITPFATIIGFVLWMDSYLKQNPDKDDLFSPLLVGLPPTLVLMTIFMFLVVRMAKKDPP